MQCITTCTALLMIALNASAATITPDSSDTYPHDPRIYHDYWNHRTSHPGDHHAFEASFQVPESGAYQWQIPGNHSVGMANAFRDLYAGFHVQGPGGVDLEDLLDRSSRTFHARAGQELSFTFTYTVADMGPLAYQALLANNEDLRRAEQEAWPGADIQARSQEVTAVIRLQQVSSDDESSCPDPPCMASMPLVGREFALIHNLSSQPLTVTIEQARPLRAVLGDGEVRVIVEGSRYTANDRIHATAKVQGLPEGGILQLGVTGVSAATGGTSQTLATRSSSTPSSPIVLPMGAHRLHYDATLPGHDNAAIAVTITATQTDTQIRDSITIEVDQPGPGARPWLLPAISLVGALWLLGMASRRKDRRKWRLSRG